MKPVVVKFPSVNAGSSVVLNSSSPTEFVSCIEISVERGGEVVDEEIVDSVAAVDPPAVVVAVAAVVVAVAAVAVAVTTVTPSVGGVAVVLTAVLLVLVVVACVVVCISDHSG